MSHISKVFLVVVLLLGLALAWKIKLSSEFDSNSAIQSDAPFGQDRQSENLDPLVDTADVADEGFFECTAETDSPYQDLDVVAAKLSKSDSPEHLLMAALYGPDRANEAGVSVALRALEKAPNDQLILWNLLYSCSQFPEVSACSGNAIEDRAIDADGGNGQLWARISGLRIMRGDMLGALDALRHATAAPRFSDYRMEHIELFERGLAAVGNPPYRERIIQAIGMQAALVSLELSVINGCKTMAAESAEWSQQCVLFGERLENDGRSMLSMAIGQGLQSKMYSISGDTELKASVEERQKLTNDMFRNPLPEGGEDLLFRDDQVLANFISNSATYGEFGAYTFLREDVERLRNQAGYDPCIL